MEFDFTSILDRAGHDASAVDVIPYDGVEIKEGFSKLPMWVADMNFATAPSVIEAIQSRLAYPTFGYYDARKEYYDAIISWQTKRNGASITKDEIGYENGVLGGVMAAVQAFTAPGDKILMHSPCYVGFTGTVKCVGRVPEYSPMKRDENGVWRMDFEDMDRRIKQNRIHTVIFCSPHNPTGRVWEKWEIEKAMEIYKNNDCLVLSDEIWADIILNGNKHIPTQSVSEDAKMRTCAFYAITKTFNLAGLLNSYHIIYNPYLRDRVRRQSATSIYNSMNVLSMYALIGAYSDTGERWLEELRQVLSANTNYITDYINDNFDGVSVARPEGTYMLYLDCSEWLKKHDMTLDELLKKGVTYGVIWQDGRGFQFPDTIRLNAALPHALVKEAMARLDKYVFNA